MSPAVALDPVLRAAASGQALRFVEVAGDCYEPVARRGDFILVADVPGWAGEGDYLIRPCGWPDETIRSCSAAGTRAAPMVRQACANPLYRDDGELVPLHAFVASLRGKVVAAMRVRDRALLRAASLPAFVGGHHAS